MLNTYVILKLALLGFRFYEVHRRPHFTDSMRSFAEGVIGDFVRDITIWGKPEEHHRALMRETMKLPVNIKPVELNEAKFERLMSSYPDELRQEVAEFLVEIANTSTEPKLKRKAVPLMMVGPPGTGSHHFCRLSDLINYSPRPYRQDSPCNEDQ